MTETEMWQQQ